MSSMVSSWMVLAVATCVFRKRQAHHTYVVLGEAGGNLDEEGSKDPEQEGHG